MSTLSIAPTALPRQRTRRVAAPAARIKAPAPPESAPALPTRQTPVRLTRRGRLVLTLLMLAGVLAALTLFSGHSAASGEAGAVEPTRSVVVGEGDTLWGLAAESAEPGEIREVVHQIQKLNSLPGPTLVEGQVLAIPVG